MNTVADARANNNSIDGTVTVGQNYIGAPKMGKQLWGYQILILFNIAIAIFDFSFCSL
jgi:hypothetical protein